MKKKLRLKFGMGQSGRQMTSLLAKWSFYLCASLVGASIVWTFLLLTSSLFGTASLCVALVLVNTGMALMFLFPPSKLDNYKATFLSFGMILFFASFGVFGSIFYSSTSMACAPGNPPTSQCQFNTVTWGVSFWVLLLDGIAATILVFIKPPCILRATQRSLHELGRPS